MRKEDRVARLEALLARVKANTAARGERPRSLLSYRPGPTDGDSDGSAPFPMLVAPRPLADEPTLEALSQRATMLTTREGLGSRPPIPIVTRAPVTVTATPLRTPAIPPPPPAVEEDAWPPSVHPPPFEPEVAPARDLIVEELAPSGLERAVRDATAERLDPLLREAALDLRDHGRRTEPPDRSTDEAEVGAEWTAVPRLPPLPEVDEEPERTFDALDAAFRPPPAPPPAPAESGRWMLWAGVAAGAALVLAATTLFGNRGQSPSKEPPADRGTASPVTEVAPPPRTSAPAATAPATQPAPSASVLAARPIEPVPDPPDVSGLGVGRGLLWVESQSPREIFVNGNQVGASGKWLNVPCGLRNVRSAKPGPPPAGSSFPMWTSDGHSVLVPCRSYTRVTMPTDP